MGGRGVTAGGVQSWLLRATRPRAIECVAAIQRARHRLVDWHAPLRIRRRRETFRIQRIRHVRIGSIACTAALSAEGCQAGRHRTCHLLRLAASWQLHAIPLAGRASTLRTLCTLCEVRKVRKVRKVQDL